MVSQGEQYLQELEALQDSPEWALFQELRRLKYSYRLHEGNYSELVRLLDAVADGPRALHVWREDQRDLLDAVMEETARLLHNFSASATSLVDHTRAHVKRLYSGTDLQQQYKARTERLSNSPVVRFVQDLRNYLHHYRFPPLTAELTVNVGHGTLKNTLALEVEKLRSWDGWTQPSRKYISRQGDAINVRVAVEEYMALIKALYEWLTESETGIHGKELDALERRYSELVRLSEEVHKTQGSSHEDDSERNPQ